MSFKLCSLILNWYWILSEYNGKKCPFTSYLKNITNGKCDDEFNIELCNYDGGACCYTQIDDSNCDFCLCHTDGERHISKFAPNNQIPIYEDDNPVPFFQRGNIFSWKNYLVHHKISIFALKWV